MLGTSLGTGKELEKISSFGNYAILNCHSETGYSCKTIES